MLKMKLEILVSTINKNLSELKDLAVKMNLNSDAILRSQCGKTAFEQENINGYTIKYYLANDRGLSKNRNELLKLSTSDLVLFADDDMVFTNEYADIVCNEFKTKKTDLIEYALNFTSRGYISNKNRGVLGIVYKRLSLIRKGLFFDERFGAGCEINCGEDTIFKKTCHKKLTKLKRSSFVIAKNNDGESTWFNGYSFKYFKNRALLYGYLHPILYPLYILRMKLKNLRNKNCPLNTMLAFGKKGKKLIRI